LALFVIACGAGKGSGQASDGEDQLTAQSTPVESALPTPTLEPATTATTATTAQTTPTLLAIPDDLVGQNAQIARDRLEGMGFTNILYASADPDDTMVLWPPNWHVVTVEPAPGAEVSPDTTIILTCSKQ